MTDYSFNNFRAITPFGQSPLIKIEGNMTDQLSQKYAKLIEDSIMGIAQIQKLSAGYASNASHNAFHSNPILQALAFKGKTSEFFEKAARILENHETDTK